MQTICRSLLYTEAVAILNVDSSINCSGPNRKTFQTSAVSLTVLWCYFTYASESDLKLRFSHLLCTTNRRIAVNMTEIMIKILQDDVC